MVFRQYLHVVNNWYSFEVSKQQFERKCKMKMSNGKKNFTPKNPFQTFKIIQYQANHNKLDTSLMPK